MADLQGTKMFIDNLARQAMFVPIEDERAVLAEINRIETLLPFVDPTAYLKIREYIPGHKDEIEAFVLFRATLERIKVAAKDAE